MQPELYYIKGMVCERCISLVAAIFEGLGARIRDIRLGELTVYPAAIPLDETLLEEQLKAIGFILLKDKKIELIRATRELVAEVYSGQFDFPQPFRFSAYASNKLGKDYDSISSLFSSVENISLEQYIINYRIQKTRELLVYTSQSQSSIAFALGFSSVAHLSRQFKMQTGLNPSWFRANRTSRISPAAETSAV